MTWRIKKKHTMFWPLVEVYHGVSDPYSFVARSIKNGYEILMITQERGTK